MSQYQILNSCTEQKQKQRLKSARLNWKEKNVKIRAFCLIICYIYLWNSNKVNNLIIKNPFIKIFGSVNPNVTRRKVKIMDNRRVYERKLSWSSLLKRQSEDFQKQYKTE